MEALHLSAAGRGYLFDKVWHVMSQDEWDAIERSGKSSHETYRDFPTHYAEPIHGAIHHMHDRPGKTEPGTRPVHEVSVDYRSDYDHIGRPWKHRDDTYLMRMRGKGFAWWHIANELRRSVSATMARYRKLDDERREKAAAFYYKIRTR